MTTFRLYRYDVNDVFSTSDTYMIPRWAEPREYIEDALGVAKGSLAIDFYDDETIYLNDAETGKPLGELRAEARYDEQFAD